MMGFHKLTMALFSAVIVDRRHVAPRLSHTNVVALNYVLQSNIFMSEDQQLRAVHLILDFEPISKVFQEIGHAIREGDHRVNRIDVSRPDFLARDDLSPVRLPIHQIPPPLVIPLQQVPLEATVTVEEEIVSSRLSLEEKIDQFCFMEDEGAFEKPVDISDSETEYANLSSIHPKQLVIARINPESEKEEEAMDLKKIPGLKGLLASRNKGGSLKEAPKTQPPVVLPSPPTNLGLQAMPNLKKRRTDHELEEGKVAPRKDNKQQKIAKDPKDKRGISVDSRDKAEVCPPQRNWAPRIKLEVLPFHGMLQYGTRREAMPIT